jgi:hypothetical protein
MIPMQLVSVVLMFYYSNRLMHKFVGMRCSNIAQTKYRSSVWQRLNLSFILHQSQSLHSTVKMHENKWVFFGVIITVLFIRYFLHNSYGHMFFSFNHPSNYYAYQKATYASYILHQIMVFQYFNSIYQTSIVSSSLGEKVFTYKMNHQFFLIVKIFNNVTNVVDKCPYEFVIIIVQFVCLNAYIYRPVWLTKTNVYFQFVITASMTRT